MKKYIIGMLFGFALAFTVSAHASDIGSLIGKTIQGEFPVTIDGKSLEKKALVVDGTSYVPLRVIGEALGYESSFSADLGITFKKSGVVNKMSTTSSVQTDSTIAKQEEDAMKQKTIDENSNTQKIVEQQKAIRTQLLDVQSKIFNKQMDVAKYQNLKDSYKDKEDMFTKSALSVSKGTDYDSWYKQFTDGLTNANADLIVLQKQANDLQSQIDALNVQPTPTP